MSEGRLGRDAGFDYAAYLEAKVAVDDTALNRHVLEHFAAELRRHAAPRIVELGAGLGTMLLRLLRWGHLRRAHYTMVDADPGAARGAWRHVSTWAPRLGLALEGAGERRQLRGDGVDLELRFVTCPAEVWLEEDPAADCEFLLAHTFMDLVDPEALLPLAWWRLRGGAFYFTGTYEGEAAWTPPHAQDAAIWAAYHASMEPRGGPRHASHLLAAIRRSGGEGVVEGAGDWDVAGDTDSQRRFMAYILETIRRERYVRAALGETALEAWFERRIRQLAAGELAFSARQVDCFGHGPS